PPRGGRAACRLPDVSRARAGGLHPLPDVPHAAEARLPELREAHPARVEHLPVLRQGLRRARLDRAHRRQGDRGRRREGLDHLASSPVSAVAPIYVGVGVYVGVGDPPPPGYPGYRSWITWSSARDDLSRFASS